MYIRIFKCHYHVLLIFAVELNVFICIRQRKRRWFQIVLLDSSALYMFLILSRLFVFLIMKLRNLLN